MKIVVFVSRPTASEEGIVFSLTICMYNPNTREYANYGSSYIVDFTQSVNQVKSSLAQHARDIVASEYQGAPEAQVIVVIGM